MAKHKNNFENIKINTPLVSKKKKNDVWLAKRGKFGYEINVFINPLQIAFINQHY